MLRGLGRAARARQRVARSADAPSGGGVGRRCASPLRPGVSDRLEHRQVPHFGHREAHMQQSGVIRP